MTKFDVRICPLDQPDNKTKAFASITVDDLIAIKGIRIVEGIHGAFVTMPQSRDKKGNYRDIAFPVTGELRKAMTKAILDEYKNVMKTAEKTVKHSKTADANKTPETDELDL